LLLVEVDEGVGKVLGRVAAVNRGGSVDASCGRLRTSGGIGAVGRVADRARACTGYREATTTGKRGTVARLEDLFGAGRQREATTFVESEDQDTGLERWGRRRGGGFGSGIGIVDGGG
jgi:hypothetical protein